MVLRILVLVFSFISTLAAFGGNTWEVRPGKPGVRVTLRGWVSLIGLVAALLLGIILEIIVVVPYDVVATYKSGDTSNGQGIAITRGTLQPLDVFPEEKIIYELRKLESGTPTQIALLIDSREYVLSQFEGIVTVRSPGSGPARVKITHPPGLRLDLVLTVRRPLAAKGP